MVLLLFLSLFLPSLLPLGEEKLGQEEGEHMINLSTQLDYILLILISIFDSELFLPSPHRSVVEKSAGLTFRPLPIPAEPDASEIPRIPVSIKSSPLVQLSFARKDASSKAVQ